MVLRRITITLLSIAGAIALGVSAAAMASPRDPAEMGQRLAGAHTQGYESGQYRTVRRSAAAASRRGTATFARRRNRSKALHRPGEHSIRQISPMILRGADLSLEDGRLSPCAAKARRHSSACRAKGLPEALLEAPSPATAQILRDIGIPAIKDVPPIAILRAGHPGADENFIAEWR